ncbi:MAG: hypothetical protein AB8G95_18790 [Anaerolineae bacterium]
MNRSIMKLFLHVMGISFVVLFSLSFFAQPSSGNVTIQVGQSESKQLLPFVTNPPENSTFYVSRNGTNLSGRSWHNAWQDFDQIEWDLVEPGDIILIDGGAESMTYYTAIHPEVSGTAAKPIVIQLADLEGRDGQAILFGGNSVPLPECGQLTWNENEHAEAGIAGIHLENGISNIQVDGRKRSGIVIHGWYEHGVKFYPDKIDNNLDDNPQDISLSYLEIFNNGRIERKNDGSSLNLYYPLHSGAGIKLAGAGHEFRFLEVHDNAGDAIQSAFTNPTGGVFNNMDDLTLSDSWLYNQRPHSGTDNSPVGETCTAQDRSGCDELGAPHMGSDYQDYPAEPPFRRESFNWCTHSDGIQIFSADEFNTMRIDRTIIGPNFMNALILGDRNNANESAWVNDLTLRDVVLTRYMHNAVGMKNAPGQAGENWVFSNVTMYGHFSNTKKDTVSIDSDLTGPDHRILNSVMVHGRTEFLGGNVAFSNNCEFGLYSGSIGGEVLDPNFETLMVGDVFADDLAIDFATVFLDNYSIGTPFCQAYGSRVRSVSELFAEPNQK